MELKGYYVSFQLYGDALEQDRCGGVAIGEGGNLTWYNTINGSLLPTISLVSATTDKTIVLLTNNTNFVIVASIIYIAP